MSRRTPISEIADLVPNVTTSGPATSVFPEGSWALNSAFFSGAGCGVKLGSGLPLARKRRTRPSRVASTAPSPRALTVSKAVLS